MSQSLQSQYDVLVHDDRIHNSLYTDPRVFEDELERIFYRGWVFIGHESELPQSGGRTTHKLRWVNDELKMFWKKVLLVNAGEAIPNLTFLV